MHGIQFLSYAGCSITVLWVEKDTFERDTAASEFCQKQLSDKCLQRLSIDFSLTTYSILDLGTMRALDHGEIYRSIKDPNRQYPTFLER